MASQISVKDPASARQWLNTVTTINQDYFSAMEGAANTLETMTEFMEGTMVDELANTGTKLLNAAKTTYDAIDKIADTVNTVLDTVKNFSENILGGISGVARAIFG